MYQFIIFAVVGGGGLIINLAVSYALTTYAGLWYFFSFIIATFVSWTFVFLANSLITFAGHSKERYARRYATFMTGYLAIFCVNAALVYALSSLLHVYYLLSITLVTLCSAVVTFFFSKRHVYHGAISADTPDDVGAAQLGE
jgi:putative flippase GtrA